MSVTGNKTELAHALSVSLPTLTRWLLRYGPDFPVQERGSNGRDYVFDFEAVFRFLGDKRAENERLAAQRDEQLAQLKLPFDVPGADPVPAAPRPTSPSEALAAWRLRKLQREEAEASGLLVPTADVVAATSAALSRFSRDTHAFLRQLGRENDWPPGYVAKTIARYEEVQRAAVAELTREFGDQAAPPPTEDARERLFA